MLDLDGLIIPVELVSDEMLNLVGRSDVTETLLSVNLRFCGD